jgi:hypothetical protein
MSPAVQLEQAASTALRLKRPTVIRIEWVAELIQACPDLFYYEPSWRPSTAVHDASQVCRPLGSKGCSRYIGYAQRRPSALL